MSTILEVRHRTTYSYASPVSFGEHRLMFRPLAGHDLRVIDWDLTTNVPWRSHWIQDTFSNSVAVVTFQEPAAELTFVCRFSVEHYGVRDHELPLEARAEKLPLELTPDEWIDLQGFLRPHSRDAIGSVAAWAREMLRAGNHETRPVLQHMVDYMRQQFVYQAREVEGTQEPHETLRLRSGTCRDYAWLMIEARPVPGPGRPIRLRVFLRSGARWRGLRSGRKRQHTRLAERLFAWRRLGALRPDQPLDRRPGADPSGNRSPSGTGGSVVRKLGGESG